MPAKKKQSAPWPLDRRRVGAEVGRGRVDPGVARDRDPVKALLLLEQCRQAPTVSLLVIGDGDLGAAGALHRDQVGGGLDRVDRHDPQVGTGPGRVVLLRLAGGAARQARRQANVRVPRAHLRDSRLVEDRDRHLAGARVELAHVVDGLRVRGHLTRVGRRLARVPLPGRRGRVIERLVVHRPLPGLAAGLIERELHSIDERVALHTHGSLQREARVDVDRVRAAAAWLSCYCSDELLLQAAAARAIVARAAIAVVRLIVFLSLIRRRRAGNGRHPRRGQAAIHGDTGQHSPGPRLMSPSLATCTITETTTRRRADRIANA